MRTIGKGFRFNRRSVFLTYSRTPLRLSPEVVLRKLSDLAEIEHYLISQEEHKEEGEHMYHLHIYIKFRDKLDTKNSGFFDITYYGKNYHPNIQKPRKKHKLWRYIKKDKRYITNMDETRPKWEVILNDSESTEEFLTEVMWEIGRMDNYAGYKTLRDLWELKRFKNRRRFK